jgi:hypothetical protein
MLDLVLSFCISNVSSKMYFGLDSSVPREEFMDTFYATNIQHLTKYAFSNWLSFKVLEVS